MPKVQVKNGRLSAACPAARRPLAVNPLLRTIECGNLAGFKRNSRDEAIGRGCGHVEKARARQKSSAMSRSGKAAARRCHTWVTTYPAGDITARTMKWTRFRASKTDAAGVIMTEMMTSKRSFAEKKTTAIPTDSMTLAAYAIVNSAKSPLICSGGVDGAIHRAVGGGLLRQCLRLDPCEPGNSVLKDVCVALSQAHPSRWDPLARGKRKCLQVAAARHSVSLLGKIFTRRLSRVSACVLFFFPLLR